MKWTRAIGLAFLGLAIMAGVALGVGLWVYRDIPATQLEAKYATDASRFMHIDGVRIHYRDEGRGPAILLLHANFSSLIGWDPWVEALEDRYRVVRFDMPAFGLTGRTRAATTAISAHATSHRPSPLRFCWGCFGSGLPACLP